MPRKRMIQAGEFISLIPLDGIGKTISNEDIIRHSGNHWDVSSGPLYGHRPNVTHSLSGMERPG